MGGGVPDVSPFDPFRFTYDFFKCVNMCVCVCVCAQVFMCVNVGVHIPQCKRGGQRQPWVLTLPTHLETRSPVHPLFPIPRPHMCQAS